MIDGHSHMLAGLAIKSPDTGVARENAFSMDELFGVMDNLGIEKLVTFVQETDVVHYDGQGIWSD